MILLSFVTFSLLMISLLPIGEWLLYPLESRFQTNPTLPQKVDGIVLLGGAEAPELSHLWQQVELGGAAERDFNFLSLAKKYPDTKLVFTGGTGSLTQQQYKGADVAKDLFQQLGLNTDKIIFERESRNTFENAIFTKKIIKPTKQEQWILITTAWHMPRSVGIFCKAGWPVIPYPVDHQTKKGDLFRVDFDLARNLVTFKTAIKEWLGLFAYYLSDKTTAILPSRC
ncbi:MAG: YdcF family protein [Woeseiaceae bacterium]